MSKIRMSARTCLVGGALALSLTLSACAGASTPASAPPSTPGEASPSASASQGVSTEHNEADIRFAQMMIPHHRQAVEMAEMAVERTENPDVKALAEQIQGAQDPEIATMTGFLEAWGAEVPDDGGMAGMDHSGMPGMTDPGMSGMDGMMTPEQMEQLQGATGAAFDRMFLEMMITHHEGAVRDSERELAEGVNPQAKELAAQIIEAQNAEIAQMRQMLQTS
ncbi:DUF305 domain-containing protein [Pseudonocardia sp. MH-G8]|uniref:DUF305 domain-containing protein n=1 Tax=Pseudonocardia sp. MH-G8 TaxID=1854588 RepID=UPI000BA00F6E|nr:DUF305 domain-containing protein [Pseudonocardia sp. MH-G8]OZM79975.1 DUF305 domain-containing protein [Pseudonocardia sp. MH-G8]